jgi:hypothetical protein
MDRLGLWILSGHGCAGLCGPRFRWQEEEAEKRASLYSIEGVDEEDALPWSWRDSARDRVMGAYDFCKTSKSNKAGKKALSDIQETSIPFSGMEQVLAAVGLPTSPQPARRGVLTEDLFESPEHGVSHTEEIGEKAFTNPVPEFSSVIPPVREKSPRKPAPSGPLMSLPYPFVGHHGAQVSSEEQVPFPPSPRHPKSIESLRRSQLSRQDSNKENVEESDAATNDEAEEEGLELELEDEEDVDIEVEEVSDRRTSGSMSSLGQPVPSRYPFQYRRPRGGSSHSSQSRSHITPQSYNSRSTPSRSTQSTGNVETSDSPWSADNSSHDGAGIPMPPRHPNVQQRRGRAGTVPAVLVSPAPAYHRTRERTRTESGSTSGSPYNPSPVYESSQEDEEERRIETPEPEGSIEEAEREDSVGLLSAGPSPRASMIGGLRHWPSSRSRHGSTGSQQSQSPSVSTRSRTQSLARSLSALSHDSRSRARSLVHSLGAASQSSVDLVRSRAHSIGRFSDSPHYSSHSDAIPSSPGNDTFGHPIRTDWSRRSEPYLPDPHRDSDVISNAGSGSGSDSLSQYLSPLPMPTPSNRSRAASSAAHSDAGTIMAPVRVRVDSQTAPVPIPGRQQTFLTVPEENPDLSSAPQSFITAPTTVMGSTTGSEETPPGQTSSRMHPERQFDLTARPM